GCATCRRPRNRPGPRPRWRPRERRRSPPSDARGGWVLRRSRSATRLESRRRAHPQPLSRGALPGRSARRDGRRVPPAGFALPFRRPAPPLRGRGDDDRGLRDHADRAARRRAHHADEPRPPERRRRGHGGVRRHRRVSDPRVPLPATAATRRGYNPGARPGARRAVRRHARAAGPAPGRGAPGRPLLREDGRVSLNAYLTLAALVISIGLFGVLTRHDAQWRLHWIAILLIDVHTSH